MVWEKIAESQGEVREFLFSRSCENPVPEYSSSLVIIEAYRYHKHYTQTMYLAYCTIVI